MVKLFRHFYLRVEFTVKSRTPRLSQNLSMEATRGLRGTNSRYLRDGTPNPACVVEWVGSLQVDLISGGALIVKNEVVKLIQNL